MRICHAVLKVPGAARVTGIAGRPTSQRRGFASTDRTEKELGFAHKMRDIPVLTGNPRPVAYEEGWKCAYKLTDNMEFVVRDVLTRAKWSEAEIKREMEQIFIRKTTRSRASLNIWSTVEEFQRTPWYRRFRPSDDVPAVFVSYDAMKLLERALIPPSLREDPYAHLRKRHMEDSWMNERYSENAAKYLTREALERQTKGMPGYGSVSRKRFLEFEANYRKQGGANQHMNEVYTAWLKSQERKPR